LQIGQTLLIHPGSGTPSPTPHPLSPIEKLTPDSEGNYYHAVKPGETLLWIANLYEVSLNELLAWNGLNVSSIIHPEQKLLLRLIPPASATPTPIPATPTLIPTSTPPTPTLRLSQTQAITNPTAGEASPSVNPGSAVLWFVLIGLALGGLLVVVGFLKSK
jgi:LysM repeat protein